MSLVQDVIVTTVNERLSYLSVTFRSGAKQLLAFIDDSNESNPECDTSVRRECKYENISARLSRPHTRGERIWLFFDGAMCVIVGLGIPVLILIGVFGSAGAAIGAWSFSGFQNLFLMILVPYLMLVTFLGLMAMGDALPSYPDTRLPVPEEEQSIDRKIVAAWKENDLGGALDAVLAAR